MTVRIPKPPAAAESPFWALRTGWPAAVLVVGAGLAAVAGALLKVSVDKEAQLRFDLQVERLAVAIEDQFNQPLQGLQGLAALLTFQPQLNQGQFASYIQDNRLLQAAPGLQGFVWNPRVMRDRAPEFEDEQRAADVPDYRLRSLGDDSHTDLYPAQWIEPAQGHRLSLGEDMGSERARRAAVERAARTGLPALSAFIGLHQDRQHRNGLLLVVPAYWPNLPQQTDQQRIAAVRGVLVAPLLAPELLARVTAESASQLSYELRDGSPQAGAAVAASPQRDARFQRRQLLRLYGQPMQLHTRSTPQFESSVSNSAPLVLFAVGLLASACLSLLSAMVIKRSQWAERRASQLEDERDRPAMVARQTANAVVITDAQGRITWVNGGFERLSGYRLEEVVGQVPQSILRCEGTEPATLRRLEVALSAGHAMSCELLSRAKDGREYWTTKEIQPLHEPDGRLAGFMSIETDITDRVRAARTARSNQSFLQTVGRIGGVGGWTIELKTRAVELSEQTCRILELLPGHVPTLVECLHWCAPQARQPLKQAVRRGVAGLPHWDFELPFVTAKGRAIWVRLLAECEYDDSGALRVVGALQDITARRAVEAEARRNETLLRGAIDAIDEAFVLYGPDDRLVFCNDKYRAIYATSADLIVPGARFEDIVRQGALRGQYADAVGRVDEWVAERMAAHHAGNRTLVQTTDQGRTLRIVERKMPDGHLVGFRIDITELVRATEAAEEGNRAKSDFIATVSHELRTPLQSIIGYAELGQLRAVADGQQRCADMFAGVLRGGKRMLRLVNDLLDLSAIDAGTMALSCTPEDLRHLVQQVVEELQPLVQARGIRIEHSPQLPALPALVDAERMQQVLRNVLANAIRFAPQGSVVVVDGADWGPQGLELTVRDHGPGIPPGELELIFDAFVQSSRTRDGSGGSGLGLAICRRIMAVHGGTIEAENAVPCGALLRMRLPAPQAAPMPTLPALPATAANGRQEGGGSSEPGREPHSRAEVSSIAQ